MCVRQFEVVFMCKCAVGSGGGGCFSGERGFR